MSDSRLLVIGGRSGVGRSSVAFALHDPASDRVIRCTNPDAKLPS